MNVLYLLFSFTTGGTERLVCDICNEMVRRDHTVHLYVVNDLYDPQMLNALSPAVRVQLQKRSVGGGGKLKTLLLIARYIRKNRIRVIHCNSLDAPELLLLKPFFAPGASVLHTIHGMHQLQGLPRWKRWLRSRLCHRIIAISQCVRNDILAAGFRPDKVITIPNAIDLSKFPPPARKALDPAAPVIGNVARIQPQVKGQDVLLRAVSQLREKYPRILCLFAGGPPSGQPEQLEALEALARELSLTENVRFLGSTADVPGFLSQIDIFVLPSRSEGFGISLVEAMAMGIPCVASDLEGPAEVLQNGTYGALFPAEDWTALAQQLDRAIDCHPQLKEKALDNVSYVKSEYNIQKMCDRLESVMQKG